MRAKTSRSNFTEIMGDYCMPMYPYVTCGAPMCNVYNSEQKTAAIEMLTALHANSTHNVFIRLRLLCTVSLYN